ANMSMHVTDWAVGTSAVRTRRPLSRVRRSKAGMAAIVSTPPRSAVAEPVHEAKRLPVLVDRAALVVDEAGVETDRLDDGEAEVGRDPGRLLRPGDPEAAGAVEGGEEPSEAPHEVDATGDEDERDVERTARPGQAPHAFRERRELEARGRGGDMEPRTGLHAELDRERARHGS